MSKSQYNCILMWLAWITSQVVTGDISSVICSIASIIFAVLTLVAHTKGE